MRDFKTIFKVPKLKNIKEKNDFYDRAYATFCVNYMNQIKENIGIEIETIDNYYDERDNTTSKVVKISALFPSFKIKETILHKYKNKEKLDINNENKSFKIQKKEIKKEVSS